LQPLLGLVFLGLDLLRLSLFRGDTLLSSASGFLVLGSASLGLVSQLLRTKGLGLLFVDKLHQNALVLEHITLALDVELVVKMAVDLLVLSVLLQETTQHAHSPHPQLLDGHTGVGSTLALTGAGMTALATSQSVLARASARVNGLGLLDDQAVLDQSTDVLSRIGVGNFIDLVRIHPDFVAPALEYGRGEPLLQSHRRHLDSSSGFNNDKKIYVLLLLLEF